MSKPALRASVRILSCFADSLERDLKMTPLTTEMKQGILEAMSRIIDEEFVIDTINDLDKGLNDRPSKSLERILEKCKKIEEENLKNITDQQVLPTERLMDIVFDYLGRKS